MREHQFDAEEAALRPKASRIEDPVTDQRVGPPPPGGPTCSARPG